MGGGYLRLTPSVPLLVLLVPVSTGGRGYQYFPVTDSMMVETAEDSALTQSCTLSKSDIIMLFTLTNRYWEEENEIDKTRRIYATIIIS